MHKTTISLYSNQGQRKYLNNEERTRFFENTKMLRTDKKLFCQLLYYTGARIAEVHNLTPANIDISNQTVVFETLKRRKKGIFREIPLPVSILDELQNFISERENHNIGRLWGFSLRTASRYVKNVMIKADIKELQSSAKGLRHGFAVYAVSKVPITLVKKWLGHARLETTEIYLNVVGLEERKMANRLWNVK